MLFFLLPSYNNRTLSVATTQGQNAPGSDGNERVLRIPQSYSITGVSPSSFSVISRTLVRGEGVFLPLGREAAYVF